MHNTVFDFSFPAITLTHEVHTVHIAMSAAFLPLGTAIASGDR
jgi:hypothetical protein